MMPAPEFDLSLWTSRLAKEENDPLGVACDSPISVVSIEQVRKRAMEIGDLGPSVPVDRFVFAKGEPPERHQTKINGLPYRPAAAPWPQDDEGNPLVFLGQFYFGDSRDYLPNLPGDVLVIFVRQSRTITGRILPIFDPYEGYPLVFEWQSLGFDHLCAASECVPSPFDFPVCYGVRHRSVDYLQDSNIDVFEQVVPESMLSKGHARRRAALHGFNRHPRTKIGGLPFCDGESETRNDGRFLASFWGVNLCTGPFPWVNQETSLNTSEGLSAENFLLLDVYPRVDLFVGDNGSVECEGYLD